MCRSGTSGRQSNESQKVPWPKNIEIRPLAKFTMREHMMYFESRTINKNTIYKLKKREKIEKRLGNYMKK